MVIVVGGHARKIGKTSVVVGLLGALREEDWTAVKITEHRRETDQPAGGYLVEEEQTRTPTDSGRYLVAGATRSFCLRASGEELREALPALLEILRNASNAIVESTRILQHLTPDLFLMVVDPAVGSWKDSALQHAEKVDAFVVIQEASPEEGDWKPPEGKPVFSVPHTSYISHELVGWVKQRIAQKQDQRAKGKQSSKQSSSPSAM